MVGTLTKREREEDRIRLVFGISIIVLALVTAYLAQLVIRESAYQVPVSGVPPVSIPEREQPATSGLPEE